VQGCLSVATLVMICCRSIRIWSALFWLFLGAAATSSEFAEGSADVQLAAAAREVRQVIAVIDWFYVRHRACPQPSRPTELARLESELGDGYSAATQGRFVEIRGISLREAWLYYASAQHPDRCTLWREVGRDVRLIWRRHNGGRWTFDAGDGSGERPLKLAP
jgi:hypothetical protein